MPPGASALLSAGGECRHRSGSSPVPDLDGGQAIHPGPTEDYCPRPSPGGWPGLSGTLDALRSPPLPFAGIAMQAASDRERGVYQRPMGVSTNRGRHVDGQRFCPSQAASDFVTLVGMATSETITSPAADRPLATGDSPGNPPGMPVSDGIHGRWRRGRRSGRNTTSSAVLAARAEHERRRLGPDRRADPAACRPRRAYHRPQAYPAETAPPRRPTAADGRGGVARAVWSRPRRVESPAPCGVARAVQTGSPSSDGTRLALASNQTSGRRGLFGR